MPIPITTFREAERPLRDRILAILHAAPDQAYSHLELRAALDGWDAERLPLMLAIMSKEQRADVFRPVSEALDALEREGVVRRAEYQGMVYFALAKPP